MQQDVCHLTCASNSSPPWPTLPHSQQSPRTGERLSQCLGWVITRLCHHHLPEAELAKPPPQAPLRPDAESGFQGYQSMASSPPALVRENKSEEPLCVQVRGRPVYSWRRGLFAHQSPTGRRVTEGHLPASLLGLGFQNLSNQRALVSNLSDVIRHLGKWTEPF